MFSNNALCFRGVCYQLYASVNSWQGVLCYTDPGKHYPCLFVRSWNYLPLGVAMRDVKKELEAVVLGVILTIPAIIMVFLLLSGLD